MRIYWKSKEIREERKAIMIEYLENLPIIEAEKLRKTIFSLLQQTCILKEKYDPVTLVPRDNEQYEICAKHRIFIENYLAVTGCELIHDSQEHFFRVTGDGVEAETLSKTSTIIILLTKLIYKDKMMGDNLQATITNLEEYREYGKNTNLLNQKLTESEWREALWLMKKHQMIEYPGALRDLEDHTPIYLYSTINHYCSTALINELLEAYGQENIVHETT